MRTRLASDPRAPGAARAFVRARLAEHGAPAGVDTDDVVLITSELVTNAVEAGASSVLLDVRLSARGLEIVVEDDAGGWPAVGRAQDHAVGGRGLHIVEQLADRWSVDRRGAGKRVVASWAARTRQAARRQGADA
jgi:anti-sigma regulatory factor (Ser/Thr protein kinase)